jgi:PIN domain nuclease of toxin-antitoxin system
VRLLLDTHIYLWWLEDPSLLSDDARIAIADPRNFVFVSSASIVEIAIKQATGKLRIAEPPEQKLEFCRFHELPFSIAHASAFRDLPSHHKDPFDRMLAAQARVEGLTLVTRDKVMQQYELPLIAA